MSKTYGIALGILILAAILIFSFYPRTCEELTSMEDAKEIIECHLNNKKDSFNSSQISVPASEMLEGNCLVKRFDDSQELVSVWFDCTGYSTTFGCYIQINEDYTYSNIYCPQGI